MLPLNHLSIENKDLKYETMQFLEDVLLQLLNDLNRRRIGTKDVELFGTNDIYVFRGSQSMVFTFSRSRSLMQPRYAEFELAEVVTGGDQLAVGQPQGFEPTGWVKLLEESYMCVRPASIIFPAPYLQLANEERKDAIRKVTELLVGPAEEDVDRKKRIVRINPLYSGRDFMLEPDLCFILMEFEPPYTDIFDTLIKPTVKAEGFRCVKSDDIYSTAPVIEDIWASINKASLVIAEISSNNPNVMYELGICHTIGKNVMMITQKPDQIPFNFRHMRCYPYTNDIPGSEELKRNISSVIRNIRGTSGLSQSAGS